MSVPAKASTIMTTTIDNNNNDNIPGWIKVWLGLFYSIPKLISIPGTKLDITFTVVCSFALFAVKTLFQRLLEHSFGWPLHSTLTWDAAASMTGIFHSMNLLPPLWLLLRSQPYQPSGPLHTAPQWWQDASQALIQFTTGYMIYDMTVNIFLLRWDKTEGLLLSSADYLYIGHHIATTFYMISTRLFQAGHISAMCCMFLGELTNPLFNSHLILQLVKEVPNVTWTIPGLELCCAILFVLIRAVVSPWIFLHMTFDLLQSNSKIPLWIRFLWIAMIWGVVLGSLPWVHDFNAVIQQAMGYTTTITKEDL